MSRAELLVVAVFDDIAVAEHAINDLRHVGFSHNEILYSCRQKRGGFFENFKSWIAGEETASIGDIAKNLRQMGMSEDAANYYARAHEVGHSIVAVNSPGHEQSAREVLYQRHGGHSHNVVVRSDATGPDNHPIDGSDEAHISLRKEQLNVEKQTVEKGEVRIYKDVVAEQQNIDVPVSHEEIVIEHHPPSQARTMETPIGQGETISIPVSEEQVHVTKQIVDTDEIDIKKRNVQGEQHVTGTVRHEELHVEQSGDVPIRRDDDVKP